MVFQSREAKGIALVKNGSVKEISDSQYAIKSQRTDDIYQISWKGDRWICSCVDYTKRQGKKCKHIFAVQYFQMMRNIVLDADRFGNFETEIRCPVSEKHEVTLSGFRYNKLGAVRRYFCKKCKIRRSLRPIQRIHIEASMIAVALDLYFRGLSLRQVAEHIEASWRRKVSYTTILRWVKKFVKILALYVDSLERGNKAKRRDDRWAADETIFRLNGRHLVIWSLLDEKTRYLLAVLVRMCRTAREAKALLSQGLKKAPRPLEFVSDGAPAYAVALKSKFQGAQNFIHIQGPGLTKGLNNNKIERLQGVMKSRLLAMGALRAPESGTTFAEGYSIYHNFIKPHRSLGGKTPAQERGLAKRKMSVAEVLRAALSSSLAK